MKINIQTFRGAAPGVTDNLLPSENASAASNCNFDEGDLRSFYEASNVKIPETNSVLTLNTYRGQLITKENFVDLVDSPIANDTHERKYYTGDGSFRAHANDLEYPAYYEPGPQQPSIKMIVELRTSGDGAEEERSYSYTFVSRYGEEGAPAPITEFPISPFKDNDEVFLSKIEAPELNHGTNRIRVYRTATGSVNTSEYYFVKDYYLPEITIWVSGSSTSYFGDVVSYENDDGNILYECRNVFTSYDPDDTTYGVNGASPHWGFYRVIDDVKTSDMLSIGVVCPSETYLQAPSELKGIIGANGGMLAGFYGKNIIFCIPNQPHAWPALELTTEYEIIGLGHYGGVTIAFTKGPPIFYSGTHPKDITEIGSGDKYPCVSKRSISCGKEGCFYATNHGLVLTSVDGTSIVTDGVMTKRTWADLSPENIHGCFTQSLYFGFNIMSGKSFLVNLKTGDLTNLDDIVHSAFVTPDGNNLYIAVDGEESGFIIKKWEGKPYSHRKYSWRSKWFDLGMKTTLVAARLTIDEKYYNKILDMITSDAATIAANQAIIDGIEYGEDWLTDYTSDWAYKYTAEWGDSGANVFGKINDQEINLYELNGDELTASTGISLSKDVTVSIFINGDEDTPVATRTVNNSDIFKLKGKYKSRSVQFLIEGYVPIKSIVLSTSAGMITVVESS